MHAATVRRGLIHVILLACGVPAHAEPSADGREAAVRAHVTALEQAGDRPLAEVVAEFEASRFSARYRGATGSDEREQLLAEIAQAAATAGGATLDETNGRYELRLLGPSPLAVVFTVEEAPPHAIDSLVAEQTAPVEGGMTLTWQDAADAFAALESQGFAGVVHLSRNGSTVLQRAYGRSNDELGYATRLDTIYGIGSTPIDFTVAGIYLLAQRGMLSLDDALPAFFDAVPDDKRGMTVRHLVSGRSGLPDFHHTPDDRDADLAWLGRDAAVRRILAQPLSFAPGEGRAHSHSAYGLAAAIIEVVSGQGYFEFLSAAFFERAGMTRTGMYGDASGFGLRDFAVGGGPSSVGVPNIPPNWGPTSWLVMGSGGMYSTLGDMLAFYRLMRTGEVLDEEYAAHYRGATVGIGGSDRGFYLFHAANGTGNEALLLANVDGRSPEMRAVSRALERLVNDGP